MMRALIVSSLVLFGALSGCLADEAKPASTTESTSPSDDGNSTASPTPINTTAATTTAAPNTPPTANLSSDVPNGTAPLNVTFTLEGADADGDGLNWTLDADGDGTTDYNGTELPSAIVHEYLEAGNYTALLNVSDGTDSAQANLTITIDVAAAVGPLVCNRTPTQTAGVVYLFEGDGGTWLFVEDNGVPGLQVANTHPIPEEQAKTLGEFNAAWADCTGGDQMIF